MANGWTGKGYTTLTIKGDVQTDVAVEFTAIQIDQCYQLKSGITNKVSVQYDPTWGNFIEPSKFIEFVGDFLKDLKSWSQTYSSNPNSAESKESAAELYELALLQQQSFEEDIALSSEERAEVLALFKPVVDGLFSAKNGTLSNSRISTDCTDLLDCLSQGNIQAVMYWLGCYKKVLSKVLDPFCEIDSQNHQQCGIVPRVLWENSESSFPAVAAGVVDGIYLILNSIENIRYSLSQAIGCLNTDYIFDKNDCQEKVKAVIGIMQAICGVVNNPLKIIAQFSDEIERITTRADDLGRVGDYYSGRAAFEFISIFVPAERIAPVLKGVNLSKAASFLKSAPFVDEQFRVVSKMLSEAGVNFRKRFPKGAQFFIKEGGITKVVGEYVDGVYKFFQQKTADFKKRIGALYKSNYDIPGANGTAGKKGKGNFGIYVKEKPNSTKADDIAVVVEPTKGVTKLGVYELELTHGITMSKKEFERFKALIQAEGIQESIKFVEYNGKKFVVDGHHRLRAAKELRIEIVPVEQV